MSERMEDLGHARVRDSLTGAEAFEISREKFGYERDGRRWSITIDWGSGPSIAFYARATPCWDDGTPVTADELRSVRDTLEAACRHWHIIADFVSPVWNSGPQGS